MHYEKILAESLNAPEKFWDPVARRLHWFKPYHKVLRKNNKQSYTWFSGGESNICYNALDRQVHNGRGKQPALVWDSPVAESHSSFTYEELLEQVAYFSGFLQSLSLSYGKRVLIFMPNIPEAAISMLASARIGAIHSVVFGGFAANELAKRISDADPHVIILASHGFEKGKKVPYKPILDKALLQTSANPQHIIHFDRNSVQTQLDKPYVDWNEYRNFRSFSECVPVKAEDPLYILYTSGTTGLPKGVLHDHAGYMVALKWSMEYVYGAAAGDIFWAASDLGWAVGHSYIVYGPLLHGCTSVLYEGKPVGTPDANAFWRIIDQYQVNHLFAAPTAFRAIKREDPDGNARKSFSLKSLKRVFLAGERSDTNTLSWLEGICQTPVIDHWWQTESGWPIASLCTGIEAEKVKHGSCGKPVPGYHIEILDDTGSPLPQGATGHIAIKLPLPPGTLPSLWKNPEEFQQLYLQRFPKYFQTYDAGYLDSENYLWITGRTDDIINVAGHRLSTASIEEIIASHPHIAESAVIGVNDRLKGQIPLGFLLLNKSVSTQHEKIKQDVISLVREKLGPVWSFKNVIIVSGLPKTRSGKILRCVLRNIANKEELKIPPTIEDQDVLPGIEHSFKRHHWANPSSTEPNS